MERIKGLIVLAVVACAVGGAGVARVARGADAANTADANRPSQRALPETWDAPADGAYRWYRCYAKVPDRWVVKQAKDLWVESVTVTIEGVAGAYEVYINGTKVGGGGAMPPSYQPDDGAVQRFKVPAGVLVKDAYNVVALRVYGRGGKAGLTRGAPVLAGYYLEAVLKGAWQSRDGDDPAWAGGAVTDRPDSAVFTSFVEANSALKRPAELHGGERLPPAESLAKMHPADDLDVDQVLTEPLVAQPVYMDFDARGRLWVVQYRQYPYPAGIEMVSRDKYYRAMYDKVPPAPGQPGYVPGVDRITIHEDTDGDGVFDKHKVFIDNLNMCTAVAQGDGGVWVLNPPYLLFYADANGDDKPDGDPVIHLQGFGLEDTHSVVNALRWGPDGWLYAAQGSTTSSRVTRPGIKDDKGVYCESAAIWRYHPATRRYELFAHGGGNAFGVEIDSAGRIYSGYNGGGTHGFHYVQGGYYLKGATSKYGPPPNPYAFGTLPSIPNDRPIARFTHAFVRYEDDALPARYRNSLICIDPLASNVVVVTVTSDGSSFKSIATRDAALASDDHGFRPVAITVGPDGAVYIADFYEQFIAHGQHFQGQIDPTTGRVYRLRAKDAKPGPPVDLTKLRDADLVAMLTTSTDATRAQRQVALRLIGQRWGDRAANDAERASAEAALRAAMQRQDDAAMRALWGLNLLGDFDDALAADALRHAHPGVRRWAVRLLGDRVDADKGIASPLAERLAEMARTDDDAEVRSQLASTAKRLPAAQALPIVAGLLTRDVDVADPHVPLLTWWALESKCGSDRAAVVTLFDDKATWARPMVVQHIAERLMRRLAQAGSHADLVACAHLLRAAPAGDARAALMKGFEQAYAGRSTAQLPDELIDAIDAAGGGSLVMRVRRGDAAAIVDALSLAGDDKAPLAQRRELVEVFGQVDAPQSVTLLTHLATASGDASLRKSALAALQRYGQPAVGAAVIQAYAKMPEDVRTAARLMLASRPTWALQWMQAAEAGAIDTNDVSAETIQQLRLHARSDTQLAALVDKRFGKVDAATAAVPVQQQIDRLTAALDAGPGNPYDGLQLFNRTCAACHTLFDKGGKIGPDLTDHPRRDTGSMLLSIVSPSAEIREGFESFVVITKDGRTVSGFLADRDDRVVSIRTLDGQTVTLRRADVQQMQPLGRSLMPVGLLSTMTDQQVRDLFAYLRQAQPLSP